jgi:hypothetical protein
MASPLRVLLLGGLDSGDVDSLSQARAQPWCAALCVLFMPNSFRG